MEAYTQIKREIRKADRLAQEGKLQEADQVIRAAIPLGLCGMDIDANMSKASKAALRKWSSENSA